MNGEVEALNRKELAVLARVGAMNSVDSITQNSIRLVDFSLSTIDVISDPQRR